MTVFDPPLNVSVFIKEKKKVFCVWTSVQKPIPKYVCCCSKMDLPQKIYKVVIGDHFTEDLLPSSVKDNG